MPVRLVENSAPSLISGANSGQTSPPFCSLLSVGQNVSSLQKDEAWRVDVRIQGCDLDRGCLCGTMEALNVPMAGAPDRRLYALLLIMGLLPEDDIRHWTKFPSFLPFMGQVDVDGGKSMDLTNCPCIFMMERAIFVNVGTDCGLTIAGFYYVCFSCSDGCVNGLYYDPNSSMENVVESTCSPFQKLELKSINEGLSGFSCSSYELQ